MCSPRSLKPTSQLKRTAKLKLSDDGSIEGDVRIEYTGHLGVGKKQENDDDSAEQQEQLLRDRKERISTAELSNIKIENAADPARPFVYSFHVRVPGYAPRTGKRLFLQPSFFERGVGALFSAGQPATSDILSLSLDRRRHGDDRVAGRVRPGQRGAARPSVPRRS